MRIPRPIAFAVLASSALLQGAEQGRFHLATEAHWGKSVLPAGDYQITFPNPTTGQTQVRIEGEGKVILQTPLVTDAQPYSASSYLKLSKIGEEYFVAELSSGIVGKTFTFSVPRSSGRIKGGATAR